MPAVLRDRLATLGADRGARPLLVALDFDGTLAPLQDDPSASRVLPAGVAVLADLARADGVVLALVSGRAVADLHALAEVPVGTHLIGSHGAERARVTPDGLARTPVELSARQAQRLAALTAAAERVAEGRDGVWVEHKPSAVVVHSRRAAPDDAAAAQAEALALGDGQDVGALHGKDVVELTVLRADKGTALAALRDELGAPVVLYAGDDVTDEHAFAVLGPQDVTVKVGAGDSVAQHRVGDPDGAVAALAVLRDALV